MVNITGIKTPKRITKTKIKALSPKKERLKSFQRMQIAPLLSKEQNMLQEMFGGNDNWGTGKNLPKIEGILRNGNGLIKNDDFGDTAKLFGGFR